MQIATPAPALTIFARLGLLVGLVGLVSSMIELEYNGTGDSWQLQRQSGAIRLACTRREHTGCSPV